MKVLSLFDGISCGMVALDRAGIKVDRYVAYEIEPNAIKISRKNYPQIEHCGDVTTADFTKYKDFDLLIGGSPCTEWSNAKCHTAKIKKETDINQGVGWHLFMEYVRAKEKTSPTYFLYENNYRISKKIEDAISEKLGVKPILINSALVSAQNRKRLYWTNIPNITQPKDKGISVKDILVDDISLVKHFDDRIKNTMIECNNYIKYDLGGKGHYSQQDRLYYLDKKMPTVPRCRTETKLNVYLGGEIYKKTCPVECERLQTLPDDYTKYGVDNENNIKEVPKTRRFEAIGNSWTVDVVAHIFSFLPNKYKK
nr:MAG TPA: Cytosine specific methyltransferase [Caudoviricetes sp.]